MGIWKWEWSEEGTRRGGEKGSICVLDSCSIRSGNLRVCQILCVNQSRFKVGGGDRDGSDRRSAPFQTDMVGMVYCLQRNRQRCLLRHAWHFCCRVSAVVLQQTSL